MPVTSRTSKALLKNGLIALACVPGAILLLGFLSLRPFTAPSLSMTPNLQRGDYFFSDRFRTSLHGPIERGDIVTFDYRGASYVKRIVGMPGETVQMRNGRLVIDGIDVQVVNTNTKIDLQYGQVTVQLETLSSGKSYRILNMIDGPADNTQEWKIPQGHYFVLGDNRDNSADSRFHIGFVPEENIHGKVRFVLFNMEGKSIFGRVF